jgi:hypothetical protein
VGSQGGTTRNDDAHPPAEALLNFRENDAIKERRRLVLRHAALNEAQLAAERVPKDELLQGAGGADLRRDAAVDAVKDAGHADEKGGAERADVVDQLCGVALPVPNRRSAVQEHLLGDAVKDVREREVGEHRVSGSEVDADDAQVGGEGGDGGDDGGVRQLDPLWVACRARGVHDGAEVLGGRGDGGRRLGLALGQKFGEGEDRKATVAGAADKGEGVGVGGGRGVAPHDDGFERGADGGQGFGKGRELIGVDEHGLGFAVVDDVLDGVLAERVVQGDAVVGHAVAGLKGGCVFLVGERRAGGGGGG